MNGGLSPLLQHELMPAFVWYRAGMQAAVNKAQGWDEAAQREQFAQCLQRGTLYWYGDGAQPQALLCMTREVHGLHVHLVVVSPAVQRQGIGRRAMAAVHALCRPGQQVTLSCFRHDKAVRAFYAALGYRLAAIEAQHLKLVRDT